MSEYCPSCMAENADGASRCSVCGGDMNIQNAPHQLPVMTILDGRYLTGRALEERGFVITYMGLDLRLEERVTIKEFYPASYVARYAAHSTKVEATSAESEEQLKREREKFLAEARTMSRFSGESNSVHVKDFFYENSTAYIVTEYIDGETMQQGLKENDPEKDFNKLLDKADAGSAAELPARIHGRSTTARILSIAIPAVIAIIAIFLVVTKIIIPNSNYKSAVKLMENGSYAEAYEAFIALGDYKDSAEKAESSYAQYRREKIKAAEVGDVVVFGTYEQDNDTSNGKEDIEWQVLAKEDNRVLVISKYALDCQPYNTSHDNVTWESCTLRTWLNGTFLNNAFSAEEQAAIVETKVTADENPNFDTDPGNDTTDKVFLLSIDEANEYFASDDARVCVPTDYVMALGALFYETASGEPTCWWWLRSPGGYQYQAAGVYIDGAASGFGESVNIGIITVRPALWINTEG